MFYQLSEHNPAQANWHMKLTPTILISLYLPLSTLAYSHKHFLSIHLKPIRKYYILASIFKYNLQNSREEWMSNVFTHFFFLLCSFFLCDIPRFLFVLFLLFRKLHLAFLFSFLEVYKIIFKIFFSSYTEVQLTNIIGTQLKCTM